ncbi:uncharacterized protein LOC129601813 [Paramacrobiotus metropolitanus]|uniref:uncharacterized protein LOC129601813 n=1 Tax=Paramacrobiotus metropolitanus TaxID=2943436 RepID=UPI002445784E|nr:uncharacterized protein LOC129601813 [Paramacrobiotus metropolitanus]XP_055356691.1 uncharacterized protein LOC129601813 [Paramacrobiotus metropolitanus]XP_055356692.1 uncharacterized protein LOC129601813 [Paramacrobiotus metropolitanus]
MVMFRLIYPDLSRYHCLPYKNGGLRRLVVLCVLVIIFVYGIQSILISKSSASLSDVATTDPAIRFRGSSDRSTGDNYRRPAVPESPEDRCKSLSSSDPCEVPYFPYRVSVGYGDRAPQICWNLRNVPLRTARPGTVTVVELAAADGNVINEKSFSVDSPKILANFLAQLRSTRNDSYIVMATWNAVPFSPTLLSHLKSVGTLVNPKFQGQQLQFYLLGQKGLLPGRGISDVQLFNSSPALDQTGCVPPLASSLGNEVDHDFVNSNPGYLLAGEFKLGSGSPNCGMASPCEGLKIPMHIYTGKDHNDPPKLCIDGNYVFENKINNGGRGMNIAVIDGFTGTVLRVANYDTWGTESTMLEVFLEDLQTNEIAVIFTHDEATTKLSELSRTLFFELGSSRIYDLKFRAAWFMIGQKGIRGFTGFERLNIGEKTNWADVIDERLCIPRRLDGFLARPDPLPETRNLQRLTFCSLYRGYGDFCIKERPLSPLLPAKLADVTLVNSPIYNDLTAILVIAGRSKNALRMLMETLLGQPGINPRQTRIVDRYHYNSTEIRDLVGLFNFHLTFSTFTGSYAQFLKREIQEMFDEYKPRYLIVIEENTLLSPDFLHYFATLEPIFEADPTVKAISAWNDNGYNETSGDLSRIYRVNGFPHQGFLVTRAFWESVTPVMEKCCEKNPWEGWFDNMETISIWPDTSRIMKIPFTDHTNALALELFGRSRTVSRQNEIKVENTFPVIKEKYDAFLHSAIAESRHFDMNQKDLCDKAREISLNAPKEKAVAIFLPGNATEKVWSETCKCFGLFAVEGHSARGRYNHTLSFTFGDARRLVIIVDGLYPFRSTASSQP